jgi:hypothetical protein
MSQKVLKPVHRVSCAGSTALREHASGARVEADAWTRRHLPGGIPTTRQKCRFKCASPVNPQSALISHSDLLVDINMML